MNNTYRPTVVIVNSDFAFIAKRNHDLYTIGAEVVTAEFDRDAAVATFKAIPNVKDAFTMNEDKAIDKTIFFGFNPGRDGWQQGNERKSDARRLGRGLAILHVSQQERAAKRLAKNGYLSLMRDGELPLPAFDDDGKPFAYYTVESIIPNELNAFKHTKVGGKFAKVTAEDKSRDKFALVVPVGNQLVTLEKSVIAHLLENGYTFVMPGDWAALVAFNYKQHKLELNGDAEALAAIRREVAERQAKAAREYAIKKGETIIEL